MLPSAVTGPLVFVNLFLSCPLTWEEKEKNKFLIVIVQSAVLNVMNKTFISLMEHVGEMARGMLIALLI